MILFTKTKLSRFLVEFLLIVYCVGIYCADDEPESRKEPLRRKLSHNSKHDSVKSETLTTKTESSTVGKLIKDNAKNKEPIEVEATVNKNTTRKIINKRQQLSQGKPNQRVDPKKRAESCPLCDSSVFSYCSDKLLHDACCCLNPFENSLPYQCQYADCSFLHANSCREHHLITACCCDRFIYRL